MESIRYIPNLTSEDKLLLDIRERRRLIWTITRSFLEADNYKHLKYGEKRKRHWHLFETLIQIFGRMLDLTPLSQMGLQNAMNIVVNQIDLPFPDLPEPFHGYTILHMTDLHLDLVPGIENLIGAQIENLFVDMCVLTGDYREKVSGGYKQILSPMRKIVSCINATDGIFATLGNHDSYQMVDDFERMGITVLANETTDIVREGKRMYVTGLDDPYYYYTDQSIRALEEAPEGFKIALVHAASLFDAAADNGYSLYLCGHTHGGQICLPGGKPIIVYLRYGRKYYRGLWRYANMTGYTGQGTGTCGIPVRFNTQSEITLFRLKKSQG
ncbi:MAG: metallophosphoesterase [Candidatus Brocadiaceae bacterium]|nr:metallophosphoesterase [Candidatus Brocadiaceae bacterium]